MTFSQWISVGLSLLVALVGSSVLTVGITAFVQRRKLDVDISKTKVDAVAVLSTTAIELATAQGQTIAKIREAWHVHREWDKTQVKRMRDAGLDVDDPPELWF